jgi:2-iminobutanoate/2-iminopropanoate deaminase
MSELQKIATEPDPYAPFKISQAIRVGDRVFVSGQAALDDSEPSSESATSTPRRSRRSETWSESSPTPARASIASSR